MNKPILSKQAFPNVDMDNIDYEKNALFVLENFMNDGSWGNFLAVTKFYGDEKTGQLIIHSKEPGPKEVNFCCIIFKLKTEDFIYPTKKRQYIQSPDCYGA